MERKTALVTGASSGLGIEFVRKLAARGYDVALTARSEMAMSKLADEVARSRGVKATVHPMDLSVPGSAAELADQLDDQGIIPDLLVNNAAFGINQRFTDHDPARMLEMVQLNMVSLTELSLRLGRRMGERGQGHILMVASMAAYQPDPILAVYGATKAYVLSLGEALHVELAPAVGVTVVSPGLMHTGFADTAGYRPTAAMTRFLLSTDFVAQAGLNALFAGRSSIVPGRLNAAAAFATRFISRKTAAMQFYRSAQRDPA